MDASAAGRFRRLGRMLILTAVIVFALAIAFWNGLGSLEPDARPLIAGALTLAGLLDLGIGIVMLRRGHT
jgi:hypothetical protein